MMAAPRFLARRPRALLLPLALLLLLAVLARAAPTPGRAAAAAGRRTLRAAAAVRDENDGPDNGNGNGDDQGDDNGRDDNGRDDNNDDNNDDGRDDNDDNDDDDNGRGNGADFDGVGSSDLSASDGAACYPAAATVRLSDGRTVSMRDLQLGDAVQVDAAGTRFEPVTLFTHRSPATTHSFVRLSYHHPTLPAAPRTLTLSPSHYASVLPPAAASPVLRAAEKVAPGDRLRLAGHGALAVVTAVERVVERGLFNPQTPSGEIVVDGVLSTCWTQEVDPRLAKLGMRLWNTWWGLGGGRSFRGLDAGWRASWMLPKGKFEL